MFSVSLKAIGVMAAAAASLGALHLETASGGNVLVASLEQSAFFRPVSGALKQDINRATKSDRLEGVVRSASPQQTIELSLVGISDTSVLVRVPIAQPQGQLAPVQTKPAVVPARGTATKRLVACEPIASILTEAGRTMAAGRCIT